MIKRSLIIFCILTLVIAAVLPLFPLQGEEEIYEKTLRLHVLANSDSEEDQCLKLKIRDRVLEYMSVYLNKAKTKDEAIEIINRHKEDIQNLAANAIADYGYDYSVSLTLTEEYYPTRDYEGVTLPAGSYTSLRILIGKAEGKNWWCVLFPALCTSSAEPKEKLKSAGFSSPQIKILTEGESPKYKLRFKLLEFFENLF